jgi:NAD(P)H-hydrate epimerase
MIRGLQLLTAKKAKEIDLRARDKFNISTLVLMENAGRAVAEEVIKMLRGKRTVAIFCGKGNNGGDGFVAARHLLPKGIKPEVFLVGYICDVQNEARVNLDILLRLKQKIIEIEEENLHLVKSKISKYYFVIDALLGVGLSGEVKGIYRDLIGIINTSKAKILAVDIPSGLDATSGKVLGCCVKADKTVTFVAKKRGMVVGEGPKHCGRIVVKDLGIPQDRIL